MVVQLSGGAKATVAIGGSSGIKSTSAVSSSSKSSSSSSSSKASTSSSKSSSSSSSKASTSSSNVSKLPASISSSKVSTTRVSSKANAPTKITTITPTVYTNETIKTLSSSPKTVTGVVGTAVSSGKSVPTKIKAVTPVAYTDETIKTIASSPKTIKTLSSPSNAITGVVANAVKSGTIIPTVITPEAEKVANAAINVSTPVTSITIPEEKLVIQSVPSETLESVIPTLVTNPNAVVPNEIKIGDTVTEGVVTTDKILELLANAKAVNPKSIATEVATILTQQNASYGNLNQILNPYGDLKFNPTSTPTQVAPVAMQPALSGNPAASAKPLQDLSGYATEELTAPQPTSFEWSLPAGKIGPNYVDAQGNIMSKDAYVQTYGVDPDYALWYMRTGQAAKELATATAATGQKSAQLSTTAASTQQYASVQNPLSVKSSEYQYMEHPSSVANPLPTDDSTCDLPPTSFEWTMPSGRVGPNYVDAQGNIMSKDAYIARYNVDPEYALQYMRSNQAAKELDNTIAGSQYQNLSTLS